MWERQIGQFGKLVIAKRGAKECGNINSGAKYDRTRSI